MTFHFVADLRKLKAVRAIVQSFCESIPLASRDAAGMVLAASEAASNAIEHAYPGDPKGPVTVHCRLRGDEVEIRVSDAGAGFEYRTGDSIDMDAFHKARRRRGLGLHVLRKFAEFSEYRRDGGTNTFVLRRRLDRVPRAGAIAHLGPREG